MYYNDLLFKLIKDRFDDIVKKQKTNPIKLISNKISVPINDIGNYLSAYPSLLFYFFHSAFKNSNSTYLETININDKEILSFEGMFLGHALSPYDESLALLAELGSFMRVSENFNFSKNRKIMLAGTEWGKMNWVVKALKLQENLKSSENFRLKLYKLLDVDVIDQSIYEVDSPYDKNIAYKSIKDLSEDYEKFSKVVFGENYLNRKLTTIEKRTLLRHQTLESIIKGSKETFDVLHIKTIKDSIEKHINVIKKVIEKLGRIDKETFEYFLLQRFQQHKFKNFIKVGVKREMSFDEVFMNLDEKDDYSHKIGGLYYNDYYFSKENNTKLTIHPYYFPSGQLFISYPNPIEAQEKAILIFDDLNKIKTLIKDLDPEQVAVIMSDLLSFYHFAFSNNNDTKMKELLGKLPKGKEIVYSWESYTKDLPTYNKEIDLFAQSIFSSFTTFLKIPYYFFPFLIAYQEISEKDINSNVRGIYSEIIDLTLQQVIINTSAVSWTKA